MSGSGLLLDTHVTLWWLTDSAELSDEVKARIDDEVLAYVSAATVWEIAIKQKLGKLESEHDLARSVLECDLQQLSILGSHARVAGNLPLLHRDPFDRMLVAQARVEGLTLVTRDEQILRYDVPIWQV